CGVRASAAAAPAVPSTRPGRVPRLPRPPILRETCAARPDCSSICLRVREFTPTRGFCHYFGFSLQASGSWSLTSVARSLEESKMRVTALLFALLLCLCGSAFAQDWELYTNNDDGFKLDFPGAPKMTQTTFKSEYGADLPAHVYTATKGQE